MATGENDDKEMGEEIGKRWIGAKAGHWRTSPPPM